MFDDWYSETNSTNKYLDEEEENNSKIIIVKRDKSDTNNSQMFINSMRQSKLAHSQVNPFNSNLHPMNNSYLSRTESVVVDSERIDSK